MQAPSLTMLIRYVDVAHVHDAPMAGPGSKRIAVLRPPGGSGFTAVASGAEGGRCVGRSDPSRPCPASPSAPGEVGVPPVPLSPARSPSGCAMGGRANPSAERTLPWLLGGAGDGSRTSDGPVDAVQLRASADVAAANMTMRAWRRWWR